MNSKLVILANSKPMALPDDFNISVELSNPIFNDVEMFSYPCTLPMEGNRHVFKNLDDYCRWCAFYERTSRNAGRRGSI